MGDPRKTRSKFQGPRHPWNKERIDSERILKKEYGLANKRELWKVGSKLKHYKDNLKNLIAQTSEQSEIERKQLFSKLKSIGLVSADASTDVILGLNTEQLLDRRLQTILVKKELARTPRQARQFITHGHVMVGSSKVTSPSYIVGAAEEHNIEFRQGSRLFNPEHPERVQPKTAPGAHSKKELKTKGSDHSVATTAQSEELPVTKTHEKAENEKALEEQIEDETANFKEVVEAVEEAEADNIANDHEKAIEKLAQEEAESNIENDEVKE